MKTGSKTNIMKKDCDTIRRSDKNAARTFDVFFSANYILELKEFFFIFNLPISSKRGKRTTTRLLFMSVVGYSVLQAPNSEICMRLEPKVWEPCSHLAVNPVPNPEYAELIRWDLYATKDELIESL